MNTIIKPYQKKPRFYTSIGRDPSRTKQAFKEECDINNIMAKYQKTGALTHANNRHPEYGFATSTDFRQSMEIVVHAQEIFDELPSSIRAKFGNSPEAFLEFAQNPDNASEMADMGLSEPTKTQAPETKDQATKEQIDAPASKDESS